MSSKIRGFKRVSHCIFDMDGLILDTERFYSEAISDILSKFEKKLDWTLKVQLLGLQHINMCKKIVEYHSLPITWEEFSKQMRVITTIILKHPDLMPDTEPIYEEIVRRIAKSFGKPYPFDVRMKIMGTTEQRSAEIAVTDLKLPLTVSEYLDRYNILCREMLGRGSLLKGAEKLIRHLHASKVPFALATSSGQEMVDIKTQHHKELFDLFGHKVCGSTDPEVKQGKPHPDIFLVAAERFPDKPKPECCLVFEDAPNGVTAGNAAGMQTVMVPDEHIPREMTSHATIVLKSLEDFKPEEFGLPPFKG